MTGSKPSGRASGLLHSRSNPRRAPSGTSEFRLSGPTSAALYDAVTCLDKNRFIARLWAKDPSIWKDDPGNKNIIKNALGWLALPDEMHARARELKAFAAGIRKEGFERVLLLGMGGSSLAPLVLTSSFGRKRGYPELTVLDSTDPEAIRLMDKKLKPLSKTLFIVSSKSGSTIEPLAFMEHFYGRLHKTLGPSAGGNFVALTDPGSLLEKTSRERSFRRVFSTPPDVGGRFSALSCFGLLPAAVAGIDAQRLLQGALLMSEAMRPSVALIKNPGVMLGALLGACWLNGRDKVTFVTSRDISSFGLWIEQLLAESTGKEGKGIVPISGEPLGAPASYSDDRVFVYIGTGSDGAAARRLERISLNGHPVISFRLRDRYALGGEFLRWEVAVAAAGAIIGINPFDQPDVELSKKLTRARLEMSGVSGDKPGLAPPGAGFRSGAVGVYFGKAAMERVMAASGRQKAGLKDGLKKVFSLACKGSYVGLLAYVSPFDKKAEGFLKRLRKEIFLSTKAAVQFGYGPRYLHSTGQLHKGGANNGVFIMITRSTTRDAEIPGAPFGFSGLELSQAYGDMEALDSKGRSTVLFSLKDTSKKTLDDVLSLIKGALS